MENILHLNSYYIDNHLYAALYKALDVKLKQNVFVPIKQDRQPENEIFLENTKLHFFKVLKSHHKYNFWGKIRALTKTVISNNLHLGIDFVHAHNLFNDGVVAYELKKRFNIPYIVAIRSTDVGLQYRIMKHRRPYIHKVLANADKVIFISETFKDRLFDMMPNKNALSIKKKSVVISNGIDDFWHQNKSGKKELLTPKNANLLYVGQIIPRKNLDEVIETIERMNTTMGYELTFTIVGDKHHKELEYFNAFEANISTKPFVNYLGKITDKQELLTIYRRTDAFIMLSKQELFGLVYIEALSQGLPIIYSDNEGISPFLKNYKVGEAVRPNSEQLEEKIINLLHNYNSYTIPDALIEQFNWQAIAENYSQLYAAGGKAVSKDK